MWQPLRWVIGCVSHQRATTLLRGCVSPEKKWVRAENMVCQWSFASITWVSCLLKHLLNSWIRYLTSLLVYLLLWAGKWLAPVTPLKQKANQLHFCSSFWVHGDYRGSTKFKHKRKMGESRFALSDKIVVDQLKLNAKKMNVWEKWVYERKFNPKLEEYKHKKVHTKDRFF